MSPKKKKIKDFNEVYLKKKGIGKGGSGTVFQVERKEDNKSVAIKLLKKDERYDREVAVSGLPKHKNILAYNKSMELNYNREKRIILEGPYFNSSPLIGNESDILTKLNIEEKTYVMRSISEAIEHLHKNKMLHRDLKPENVLVKLSAGKKPNVKLIDYGVCKNISNDTWEEITDTKDFIGTERTSSPKALRSSKRYNNLDDIYSAGITFLEILLGHKWNEGMTPADTTDYLYKLEFENFMKNKFNSELPLWLIELISSMTKKNEKERIKNISSIVEALKNQRNSSWWLEKLEKIYQNSKIDYALWEQRKVVVRCIKCNLIYTYKGKELADKMDTMKLKWEDLVKDHKFDTRCLICRKEIEDLFMPEPFPIRYEYFPGRVIEIKPEPIKSIKENEEEPLKKKKIKLTVKK